MYNKLFGKIVDSSIWLESASTRLVWLTMIAVMDEDGFVQMASVANLAHRARVSYEETTVAIEILEKEDPNSSDPDNDGKRIEKVPGGWLVLNAPKYREIVTREESKRKNRERVARFRAKHKDTKCNGDVMNCNKTVMQSDTDTDTYTNTEENKDTSKIKNHESKCVTNPKHAANKIPFDDFWKLYDYKKGRVSVEKKWNRLSLKDQEDAMAYIPGYVASTPDKKYRKHPQTFLNQRSWEDEIIDSNASASNDSPQINIDIDFLDPLNEKQQLAHFRPMYGFDWEADDSHAALWDVEAFKFGMSLQEYGAWRYEYSQKNGPYSKARPLPECDPPGLDVSQ